MATDLLPHIQQDQADPSIFNATCQSVSLGPVTAKFCITILPPSVSVELSIFGFVVANCTLSSLHPTCKIGGQFQGFKAELDLTLDIPGKKLDWKLTVCAPIIGCKTLQGAIPF